MKKKYFPKYLMILAVIALLLFVGGCGDKDKNKSDTKTKPTTKRYIGEGAKGLVIQFLEGAPPEETFDDRSNFGISVRVENNGEYDVLQNKAELKLTGFRPADFLENPPAEIVGGLSSDLNGRALDLNGNELQGGLEIVDFSSDFAYQDEVSGNTAFPIRMSVCYEYKTMASGNLCYESNLVDPDSPGEVCEANGDVTLDVSTGPVQIEPIIKEQVAGAEKISFSFTVTADENFEIYKADDDNDVCEDDDSANENTVHVMVDTGMDTALICTGLDEDIGVGKDAGYVKLFSGSRLINCIQESANAGDFTKEMKITVKYDARSYEQTQITVRHVPRD